jgi:hypothetical protein
MFLLTIKYKGERSIQLIIGLNHIVNSFCNLFRFEYTEKGSRPHLARVYLRVYFLLLSGINLSGISTGQREVVVITSITHPAIQTTLKAPPITYGSSFEA